MVTLSEQERQRVLRLLTDELWLAVGLVAARGYEEEEIAAYLRKQVAAVRSLFASRDDGHDRTHNPVNDREIAKEG